MARKNYLDQLITEDKITEEIKLIPNSDEVYISENGNIYVKYKNGYYKKSLYCNPKNHYIYCGILYNGAMKTKRVHRLVAEAFIENPNHYPIVGHKDNDKTNNTVANLYWTTVSENTQKAFDDGLAHNDKGFDDSQSFPVKVFDIEHNLIAIYGSCSEAAKALGLSKSTVCRQCKNPLKTKSRCGYYFEYLND